MLSASIRHLIPLLCLTSALESSETVFSISEQVKNVIPSVVKIKVQRSSATNEDTDLISIDAGGSGFVLDGQHHIVTNAHVIGDAKKIVIIDRNNTEYPAALIGKDDKTDIAVLDVPTFTAPTLPAGDTERLSAGDGVFVIGAPFSLGYSVSTGIVSAMHRFLPNYPYLTFIQTDAAINPGNSGGPMFDLNGQLIGMASTHFSRQGGYTNIGFAIPIEEINRIANGLIVDTMIKRGYLGAKLFISERLSRKLGYRTSLLITHIEANSPAEKSGLRAGDIIIGANGQYFQDGGELYRLLESSQPQNTVLLSYVRNKQESTTPVILEKMQKATKENRNIGSADEAEKLGLILNEDEEGISIILSYSMAGVLGFESGDKILRINGNTIKTIKELNTLLGNMKENDIALLGIRRNQNLLTLPIGSKMALKGYSTDN